MVDGKYRDDDRRDAGREVPYNRYAGMVPVLLLAAWSLVVAPAAPVPPALGLNARDYGAVGEQL